MGPVTPVPPSFFRIWEFRDLADSEYCIMDSYPSIPKLKDRENYVIWKFVIDAAVEAESFVTNRRADYLESKTKQFIVSSVSEKILYSISQYADSQTMFNKLETLYGNRKEDLNNLYTQFQTFVYDEK